MDQLVSSGAPWWLIALLVLLGVGVPAGGSQKAATIPGPLGSGARWWQDRKQRRRDEIVAEAVFVAELTASERVADKEIARLDQRYYELAADCEEDARRADDANKRLTERVDKLEAVAIRAEKRFFSLLAFTRLVVSDMRHTDPEWHRSPPEQVAEFF